MQHIPEAQKISTQRPIGAIIAIHCGGAVIPLNINGANGRKVKRKQEAPGHQGQEESLDRDNRRWRCFATTGMCKAEVECRTTGESLEVAWSVRRPAPHG
ncbi:hypothetical protein [Streptosporangium carneum]|uniref:Uncharacterized protein n=1 Tax=Streptosporangium carneum TaxID=47481 RepID=A0A9W6I2C5_9ACTN|nr:hypothetical protein [Streptosporangium carneum]GLK10740.1 hypothetical protein GCM10017600_41460 [Streptosporangium carneum]